MEANHRKVNEIFNVSNKTTVYKIPPYQREYVWDKKNWDFFINDIQDSETVNGESHFLGSIITINDKNSDYIDVVDGQQRLTTISIALIAIRVASKEIKVNEEFEEEFEELRTFTKNQVSIKDKNISKLIPSLQKNDKEQYNAILFQNKILKKNQKYYEIDKNSKIVIAFEYFVKEFKSFSDRKLYEFYEKLNTTVLIEISVSDYNSANRLFETLNNRGQELTPMDLIKNIIFSKLDSKSIESSIDTWNKLVTYVNDAKKQERFLRHFYNAFSYKKEINVLKKKKITNTYIIDAFGEILKKNRSEDIFNDIFEKSKIYGTFDGIFEIRDLKLQNITHLEYSILKDELFELKKIGTAPAYIYLLFLFDNNINQGEIRGAEIIKIVRIIKKYFIRRSLTGIPATNTLDDLFINLIEETIEYLKRKDFTYKLTEIIIGVLQNTKRYATEEQVKKELKGKIYKEHRDLVKFLLIMYENANIAEKEKTKDLWENVVNDKGSLVEYWTIEHILPQKINSKTNWLEMLSSDKKEAKQLHEKYLHTLGNLTLTAYNSKLSNRNFEDKKTLKDNNGNIVGYLSNRNLKLNDNVKNEDKWSYQKIENRTDKMVNILMELLKIEESNYKKENDIKVNKIKPKLSTTKDLFEKKLIEKGDKLYIKKNPTLIAEVIDGKYVLYNGKKMTFNRWGQDVTGWKSIQIYVHAFLEKNNKSLDDLRKKI